MATLIEEKVGVDSLSPVEALEVAVEVEEVRSDTQKAIDSVLGVLGATEGDKLLGKIAKTACGLFLDTKATRKYLVLGAECHDYVVRATGMGVKRADVITRIEDRLREAGIGSADLRVNDWIAVYGLATLCTGQTEVKDMDNAWVGSYAYRTLAILKVAMERDGDAFAFKYGWREFALAALRDGLKGKRLEDACKEHAKVVADLIEANARKSLSPEQIAQRDAQQLSKERDKITQQIVRSAESIRDTAVKAHIPAQDLADMLVNRGIIPAPTPVKVPMDFDDLAHSLDHDGAIKLAQALCERGNVAVVTKLASELKGWLLKVTGNASGAASA